MAYTTEQRRANLARAREAKAATKASQPVGFAVTSQPVADLNERLMAAFDKLEILWLEREAAKATVKVIPYQCVECRASVMAPHPTYRTNGEIVECPNRYSLHQGNLTTMDYTP